MDLAVDMLDERWKLQEDLGMVRSTTGSNSTTTSNTDDIGWMSQYVSPGIALRVDGDLEVTGKIKGGKDMMGLYEVYVVEKKRGIYIQNRVIAKNERIAERKTGLPTDWDIDNLEFFTRCIGTWEDKKPKEVKIVK